ncbi:Transcription termination/antitermination family protein [Desulfonema limicola]|uniref:Transcription termination/antitermination family protein n=1 Tax=Desulfonema limicola TaxID=45656 RepID=A0A975B8T9_9BACT|nr:UpxY family transcription antiterminator [Desulfonema limicola]QTA80905.1 Transcription termination/antitermination family protein [Desulfonema limicola]
MSIITLKQEWYVLHTKSRFENIVYDGLEKKSKEVFLPKIWVASKRKDRKSMLHSPLFPGYVFVKTDLDPRDHLDILKTTGAVKLIGNNNGPVPVPKQDVESLKIMVAADEEVRAGSRFLKGDRVIVLEGPLAGVIGIFVHQRGQGRIMVNIDILGQNASAVVDEDNVEKLP